VFFHQCSLYIDSSVSNTVPREVNNYLHCNFFVVEYTAGWAWHDRSVKEALRGHWFTTDQELKKMVHAWLVCQPKTFYFEDIRKTVWWWAKCVKKQGDCVEKDELERSLHLL
jgi:hypothetical protein